MWLRVLAAFSVLASLACYAGRHPSGVEKSSDAPRQATQLGPTTTQTHPGPEAAHAAPTSGTKRITDADFAAHVAKLRKRLPSRQFSIVIQRPFVVIGDESRQMVTQRAEDTVKWATSKLKQDFFAEDPKEILDIWLFKNQDSYEKNAKLLFGDEPSTPYGYYSSSNKALIMNIETGGGTLVHELVHPFVEANFPACPPWLNEGLGSLYEQCGEVDGHIYGFPNWRLPGLQSAIKSGGVSEFKDLMAMDQGAFYNDDRGVNYAQSRYLCYYLQEKNLLVKFYREFVSNQKEDPSGFKQLQRVLGETDMKAFKKRWEEFVLQLTV